MFLAQLFVKNARNDPKHLLNRTKCEKQKNVKTPWNSVKLSNNRTKFENRENVEDPGNSVKSDLSDIQNIKDRPFLRISTYGYFLKQSFKRYLSHFLIPT